MTDVVTLTVDCKGEFLSHVIGKGGQKIKEIREKAPGVNIDIPKGADPKAVAKITVKGPKGPAETAKKEIERVIKRQETILAKGDALHSEAYADVEKHAKLRDQFFEDSKKAFESGDKAKAKELSDKAKEHAALFEKAKEKAGATVAKEKNKDSKPNEIDLHGLQVEAAIKLVEEKYQQVIKAKKFDTFVVIPGAGHHSDASGPKIQGKVQEWIKAKGLTYTEVQNGVYEIPLKK